MRDLSDLLWCDLVADEERIEFLESGRAYETGVIAHALVGDFVLALRQSQRNEPEKQVSDDALNV